MKTVSRVLIALVAAIAALFVSTGTSHAGLDNELSLVDGQDRTLTVQQWDTFLNGVFPLDRNRLTREWFHSGRARYIVAGPGAEEFEGTLELGYQIGFPWSLGVGINFSYTTPNILIDDGNITAPPFGLELGHYAEPVPRCVDLALTWVTARVFRKSRRSPSTWPDLPVVWRSPTRMAR